MGCHGIYFSLLLLDVGCHGIYFSLLLLDVGCHGIYFSLLLLDVGCHKIYFSLLLLDVGCHGIYFSLLLLDVGCHGISFLCCYWTWVVMGSTSLKGLFLNHHLYFPLEIRKYCLLGFDILQFYTRTFNFTTPSVILHLDHST